MGPGLAVVAVVVVDDDFVVADAVVVASVVVGVVVSAADSRTAAGIRIVVAAFHSLPAVVVAVVVAADVVVAIGCREASSMNMRLCWKLILCLLTDLTSMDDWNSKNPEMEERRKHAVDPLRCWIAWKHLPPERGR